MKSLTTVRVLYVIASAYDALLGFAFLVAAPAIFAATGITPPNHWGYIHFAAGILVIFGMMFLMIALRPVENRNLVVYGVLLKICYVATVCWHWYAGGIPDLWKYFALADALFAVAFIWSLVPLEMAAAEPNDADHENRPAAA
ncbi:MAG TPA: hypothetical protein VHE61_05950 [Opitutaceae bacterium]|nr:hypothetical protein [Opitutaceae bacterium]